MQSPEAGEDGEEAEDSEMQPSASAAAEADSEPAPAPQPAPQPAHQQIEAISSGTERSYTMFFIHQPIMASHGIMRIHTYINFPV